MAFPTTAVIDDFNRANQGPPPSANWQVIYGTGLQVISNALSKTANTETSGIIWTATTFGPNTEAYYTVANAGGSQASGRIYARIDAGFTGGYSLTWNAFSSQIALKLVASGTETQLGAAITQAISDGDSIGIEIVGTGLTAYFKVGAGAWSAIGSRSDTTWAAGGRIGVDLYADTGTAVILDNFGGGTVVAVSSNRAFMKSGKFWGA